MPTSPICEGLAVSLIRHYCGPIVFNSDMQWQHKLLSDLQCFWVQLSNVCVNPVVTAKH